MGPDSTHDEVSDELTEAQQLDVGGGAGERCVDTVMGINIHHVTLSVTDSRRSADWYRSLLGEAIAVERAAPGWKRTRLAWPSGLVIGLTQHDSTDPRDSFDHSRVGLDHLGLACANEAEVRGWLERMDVAGIEHGPMENVAYGWAVTARDPDGIAVEFFCPKS